MIGEVTHAGLKLVWKMKFSDFSLTLKENSTDFSQP